MNNIKFIDGDLIDLFLNKEIDAGLHQANSFCVMGAGIALQIKKRLPKVFEMDQLTVRGDIKKLGQFSCWENDSGQIFANIYGQYRYGRDKRYTDYDAVLKGLENFKDFLIKMGKENAKIGIPFMIGCRNAGGNWEKVLSIIKYVFENTSFEIFIVNWNKKLE